ncbi:hypothetical protein ACNFIA_29945 [Pseudomonas sp. NY15437]|uniref:hypothetical protein n=1 Tax=unclassified Pseudomonas TaxID=196821 RepID=UPI0005A0DB1D|nr:hypothetical protein [Pseudomonas sp. ATCC 13867]
MQLQYAFMLKQILPLILHARDESAELELETGVRLPTGPNNIDILVIGRSGRLSHPRAEGASVGCMRLSHRAKFCPI